MIHARFNALVAVGLAAVLAAACDRHDPVAPAGENSVVAKASTSHDSSTTTSPSTPTPGTPSDTATHPSVPPTHTSPPPDSGKSSYNGPVTVSGRVLAMQIVTPPAGTAGDTIRTSPVAGASISVIQSSIEGFAMGTTVAHATTDADGSFTVPNLTAGAYRLSVTPPAGSGLSAAVYDFVAQQATVSVTIQLPFVR